MEPQLHVLQIKFEFNGKEDVLYPVILQNDDETILIDCGYPGFMSQLEEAASLKKIQLQDLTGIIITHHDLDHMGALYEIKKQYPAIKVFTSAEDAPYVSGKKKSLRLQQAEDIFPALPEEHKEGALLFQQMLKAIRPVEVDQTFDTDQELPFMKGVSIIHTPGHMPGHISLYLEASRTLIAADAVVYDNEAFDIANPDFTLDLAQALASVITLRKLHPEKIVCYHGGLVEDQVQQKLDNLITTYAKVGTPKA